MSAPVQPGSRAAPVRWHPVIGLEVHVQLATASKMFCRCEARFGAPPNSLVCPVCSGQPGTLPVLNAQALRLGVLAGLALRCRIDPATKFDRKNYFYPDLPKGYQISQFDQPLCREGVLEFEHEGERRSVRIVRAHLEEDSGKIIHPEGMDLSLVDLNRAGTPLLEIVSGPDIRSTGEAAAYLQALRRTLRYAGVSECDMEKGSFRCDANLSLRAGPDAPFGTRTEIKNLNSFRFVAAALQAEAERQGALLDRGEKVIQSTMAFDPRSGRTAVMRTKEDAHDYRYFPEPDLPRFAVDPAWVERLRAELPELPDARRARFLAAGLAPRDAEALLAERVLADYHEAVLAAAAEGGSSLPAPSTAGWVLTEVLRLANERRLPVDRLATTPARLAGLLALVHGGQLSVQAARQVVSALEAQPGADARQLAQSLDLLQVSDSGALEDVVRGVLADQADMVARYRSGKTGLFNALLGSVMKASGGKANPGTVRELLARLLDASDA
jgi:aspartyl-tRNA(Asn)/glutamyl-tRNA(Gln) amidotransferase subunit B